VPDQILIAFVAKLTLYGFWCGKGRFPEFLKTSENSGAMRFDASLIVGVGVARGSGHPLGACQEKAASEPEATDGVAEHSALPARTNLWLHFIVPNVRPGRRRPGSFLFGMLALVVIQPALQKSDGGAEVVVERQE